MNMDYLTNRAESKSVETNEFGKRQSEWCAAEICDIESRPINGVRYDTLTSRPSEKVVSSFCFLFKPLNVLQAASVFRVVFVFDLKKFGTTVEIALSKEFPSVPPEVSFVQGRVPQHPMVDQETGYVRDLWSNGSNWSKETKIRDICAKVVAMLAQTNTQVPTPPTSNSSDQDEFGLRFPLNREEFDFFCQEGSDCIAELRTRFSCTIKYRFKKGKEGPHLLIKSNTKSTEYAVATDLDQYLQRRRAPRFNKFIPPPNPEQTADDFVSLFAPAPATPTVDEDLIKFGDDDMMASCDTGSPTGDSDSIASESPRAYMENETIRPRKTENTGRKETPVVEFAVLVEKVEISFKVLNFEESRKYSSMMQSLNCTMGKIEGLRRKTDWVRNGEMEWTG